MAQLKKLTSDLSIETIKCYNNLEATANPSKSRYLDILWYDYNSLTSKTGILINASPIKSAFDHDKIRIAAQGPKKETVQDFWNVIWKLDISLIAMLTLCVEKEREKCALYWPTQVGQPLTIVNDQFEVHLEKEESFLSENGTILGQKRWFKLVNSGSERIVQQFHIDQWEDHATLDQEKLNDLIPILFKNEKKLEKPSLIHCSAGVGRTGVVIACLMILEMIEKLIERTRDDKGNLHPELLQLDYKKMLIALRQQRIQMIQTPEQFASVIQFFLNQLEKRKNSLV